MLVLLTTDPHVEMLGHMFAGLERTPRDFFGLCTKIGFISFFVRLIRCSPHEASLNKPKHFGSKWAASHSYHTAGLDTIFSHIYLLER